MTRPTKPKETAEKQEARSSKFEWRRSIDFFRFEHQKSERDVHTVVLESLEAGVKQLERIFNRTSERFDARLEGATPEQEDWIVDDFIDIRADHEDQARFLRNIAIVALLARLTHVLRQLARQGDEIAARSDSGYPGENEFQQLWAEFRLRFGIQVPPKHIQWIEPLRRARNLIVHNGGLANPIKYEANEHGGLEPKRDTSFSKRYRKFVEGEDYSAEVRITQVQLITASTSAVALSAWLATRLRELQLALRERVTSSQ
jgi:hypothetical protein